MRIVFPSESVVHFKVDALKNVYKHLLAESHSNLKKSIQKT